MLPIAPSTYYDHLARRADPSRLSDRAKAGCQLRPEVERVFDANFRVLWRAQGMATDAPRGVRYRSLHGGPPDEGVGIEGIIRGKRMRTTIPDKAAPCPLDRANRQFRVPAPNMLWVSDFTYVATWQGFVYVAFVIDAYARASSAGASVAPPMPASSSTP